MRRLIVILILISLPAQSFGIIGAVTNGADNYLSQVISVDDSTWSVGDMFSIRSRPADDGFLPWAVIDDSLYSGPDSLGIVNEDDTAPFFGVVDTENSSNSGPCSATWTFDITGMAVTEISIDFAAMGDFEISNDSHTFSASIDGGIETTIFSSTIDEDGSQNYTLADGSTYTLNDPLLINGVYMNNIFTTLSSTVTGAGNVLTLNYEGQTNGGEEAFAFRNIILEPVILPIANAGADIVADAGEEIVLDASSSYDPDGSIVQYEWSALPEEEILYSGPDSTFTTKALGRVEEIIKLTVTDDSGGTAEDTLSIFNRRVEEMQAQISALQQKIAALLLQIQELQQTVEENRMLLERLPQLQNGLKK